MTAEQLDIIITAQTAALDDKLSAVSAVDPTNLFSPAAVAQPQSAQVSYAAEYGGILGAAASVLELNAPQTLIGAFSQGGSGRNSAAPIEIHTTVELDGDAIGESVALYNNSRSRITNGAAE